MDELTKKILQSEVEKIQDKFSDILYILTVLCLQGLYWHSDIRHHIHHISKWILFPSQFLYLNISFSIVPYNLQIAFL